MKSNLKYIKEIFKVLYWPVVFTIGQFLIQYIFISIFNFNEKGTMKTNEFLEYIKTIEYQEKLNDFMNSKSIIIIGITAIIFIPILYKVYKKYKIQNNFKFNNIFILILLGVNVSLIYNIVLFYIDNAFKLTNIFKLSSTPILVQLISSGICGPIIEELIFRGIVYNKLKEFNKPFTAVLFCSVIFAIVHNNIINVIYAFLISFILIYVYEKYKTLKAPIIVHMSLNIIIILMLNLLLENYIFFNLYLLIVNSLILLFIIKYLDKNNL